MTAPGNPVFGFWPYNLLLEVMLDEHDAMHSWPDGIAEALSLIPEDEAMALKLCYENGATIRQIADACHISPSSVRSRISRGLLRLRYPNVRKLMQAVPFRDFAEASSERGRVTAEYEALRAEYEANGMKAFMIEPDPGGPAIPEAAMAMPVEDLGLSARAYNCLYRGGIRTVRQLSAMTEADLLALRNMGRHTLQEITERLRALEQDEGGGA